ncbi:MAG: hypothetical protein ACUVWP_07165 [bacterium]
MKQFLLINSDGKIIKSYDEDRSSSEFNHFKYVNLSDKNLLKELKGIEKVGEWMLINVKTSSQKNEMALGIKTIYSGKIAYQLLFLEDNEMFVIFNTIIEKIVDIFRFGVLLLSYDGIVIFANYRVKEILGLPPFINIISTNFLTSKTLIESKLSKEIEDSMRTNASKKIDIEFINFSGKKIDVSISVNPISIKGSDYTLIAIEDIAGRKKSVCENDEFILSTSELYKYISNSLKYDDPSLIIKEGVENILRLSELDNGLLLKIYGNKLVKVCQFKKSSELEEILSNPTFSENLIKRLSGENQIIMTNLNILFPGNLYSIENGLIAKRYEYENYSYIFMLISLESKDVDIKMLSLIEKIIDIIFFLYCSCLKNLSERFKIKLSNITISVLSALGEDISKNSILNIFNEKLFKEFKPVFSTIYLRDEYRLSPLSILTRNDISEYIKFLSISDIEIQNKYISCNLSSCPYKIIEFEKSNKELFITIISISDETPSKGLIVMGFEGLPPNGWVEFIEQRYQYLGSLLSNICSYYDIREQKNEFIMTNRLIKNLDSIYSKEELLKRINEILMPDLFIYIPGNDEYKIMTKLDIDSIDLKKEIKKITSYFMGERHPKSCLLLVKEDLRTIGFNLESLSFEEGLLVKSNIDETIIMLWQEKARESCSKEGLLNIGRFITKLIDIFNREDKIKLVYDTLTMLENLRLSKMNRVLFMISLPIIASMLEKFFNTNNLCLLFSIHTSPVIEYSNGIFNIIENPDVKDKIIKILKNVKFDEREIITLLKQEDNSFVNNEYLYIIKIPTSKIPNYIIISVPSEFGVFELFILKCIVFEFSRVMS